MITSSLYFTFEHNSKDLVRVKELENEKDQLEKLNKSNENVINWLNKQLAEYKTAEATLGNLSVILNL